MWHCQKNPQNHARRVQNGLCIKVKAISAGLETLASERRREEAFTDEYQDKVEHLHQRLLKIEEGADDTGEDASGEQSQPGRPWNYRDWREEDSKPN